MIEVIKYGRLRQKKECFKCGCVFTFSRADLDFEAAEKNPCGECLLPCPDCGHPVAVRVFDAATVNELKKRREENNG